MKILLLGEFSGFFINLKKGLELLGHDVYLIAGNDGWKNIDGANFSLSSKRKGILRKTEIFFKYLYSFKKMKGYDIVLIINTGFIKPIFKYFLPRYLKNNNGKIYLSACGDDFEYINAGKTGRLKYWYYEQDVLNNITPEIPINFTKKNHYAIMKYIDGVIPISYDYELAWLGSKYRHLLKPIINLPLSDSVFDFNYPDDKGKIVIFHGVNRADVKGSDYIISAMERIEKEYDSLVEIKVVKNLPLDEYLKILNSSHIVLDQCKVYSGIGMNSLYSMAKGKVVLTSYKVPVVEPGYKVPVIDISADEMSIYETLKKLLIEKETLRNRASDIFEYTKEHHNAIIVAKKYESIFNEACIIKK
ncbi:TPA: hypothetical protein ACX6QR_003938 [Photobacterium damselae]